MNECSDGSVATSVNSPSENSGGDVSVSRTKRRKRMTFEGADGARYSIQGKRIGRPKIDRSRTKCCSCQSTHTPQWRYVSRDDEALQCLPGAVHRYGTSLSEDGTPRVKSSGSSPSSSVAGSLSGETLEIEGKICLCNACWLRVHKARQRTLRSMEEKRQCRRRINTMEFDNGTSPDGDMKVLYDGAGRHAFTDMHCLHLPGALGSDMTDAGGSPPSPFPFNLSNPYLHPPGAYRCPPPFPYYNGVRLHNHNSLPQPYSERRSSNRKLFSSSIHDIDESPQSPPQVLSASDTAAHHFPILPVAARNTNNSHRGSSSTHSSMSLSDMLLTSIGIKSPKLAAELLEERLPMMALLAKVEAFNGPDFSLPELMESPPDPQLPLNTAHSVGTSPCEIQHFDAPKMYNNTNSQEAPSVISFFPFSAPSMDKSPVGVLHALPSDHSEFYRHWSARCNNNLVSI